MNIFALMKIKSRDKQRHNLNSVINLINKQMELSSKYRLNTVSLKDLNSITFKYLIDNKPSTPSSLLTNHSGKSYQCVYERLNRLIDKGLLINISTTDRMLLAPTELAINEIKGLIDID